ncbi:MAG: N-acetyl-1-D-myo-inositol-2-amino-2-deoxy-alpha-D-glucopyranoside deacetylase [Thermocrispum sp.]
MPDRTLLLVHAHPDDETLATGGTIARYAGGAFGAGVRVAVVTCTLGEEGEIIPPGLTQLGSWAADQLGGYRHGELAAACAALGVAEHRFLGGVGRWRDSGMAGTPSVQHPRAFVQGDLTEQAGRLRTVLDELRPQVVVTYDNFGGYGHPDHVRAHEVTMAAAPVARSVQRVFHVLAPRTPVRESLATLRAVPGMPFTVPEPDDVPTVPDGRVDTVVDTRAAGAAKLEALRAHATQVAVWDGPPACWALSNGQVQANPGAEYFALAHGPTDGCADDLFGGLA